MIPTCTDLIPVSTFFVKRIFKHASDYYARSSTPFSLPTTGRTSFKKSQHTSIMVASSPSDFDSLPEAVKIEFVLWVISFSMMLSSIIWSDNTSSAAANFRVFSYSTRGYVLELVSWKPNLASIISTLSSDVVRPNP